MWNGRAASKLFFHFQNRVNSPGHHRWRTFGHQSRNIPLLQEILDTAHWRSCSSWMCSHTARPRYHSPENNNAYSESLLFSAKKRHSRGLPAHMKWSILRQESIQWAAAWASIQPEHQRVLDWVSLRGHKPAGDQDQGWILHEHTESSDTPLHLLHTTLKEKKRNFIYKLLTALEIC